MMHRYFSLLAFAVALFIQSCSNAQTDLSPKDFAGKIEATPDAQIVDVRTPGEYEGGHIANALNYDWNSDDFDEQAEQLDKNEPVFVYCLSGGRSSSAAGALRSKGYTVYELKGGMMKWRSARMPETKDNETADAGMSLQEYNHLAASADVVLVDFYADWCKPCKEMKPYLDEIANDMAGKVKVVRIDADANASLCEQLGVDALPELKLYKGNKLTWENTGYIDKSGVMIHLQ